MKRRETAKSIIYHYDWFSTFHQLYLSREDTIIIVPKDLALSLEKDVTYTSSVFYEVLMDLHSSGGHGIRIRR